MQKKAETTIDIAALIEQSQANPELAATLAGPIGKAKKFADFKLANSKMSIRVPD